MAEQQTCGEGLAAHSELPEKLGDLTAAVADVLGRHTAALDLGDDNAKRELDVYRTLVDQRRQTAAELHSTAEEMRGHRGLPVARHDPSMLASPTAADAFERFVALEEQLIALLQARLTSDRPMLDEMRQAAA
jgi:hypothetical protein